MSYTRQQKGKREVSVVVTRLRSVFLRKDGISLHPSSSDLPSFDSENA